MGKVTKYTSKQIDDNGIIEWTDEENLVWRDLITRQLKAIKGKACDEYFVGLDKLKLPLDRVPQLDEVSKVLEAETGWICEPVNKGVDMPSQEMIYDYAAFFLNTIAGQAYLFRRGSKIRLLILYYSVLVLDRADRQDLNHFGIDVKPHPLSLISEFENYRFFVTGREYVENLKPLKKRYVKRGV